VLRRLLLATLAAAVVLVVMAAVATYVFVARDGVRRALEAQATAWIGEPVRIGAARAQFLPRIAIQLEDVRVGDPVQLDLDDVELAADFRPLLAGRIENADVLVSDSRVDMPLPFGLPRSPDAVSDPTAPPAVRIVSIRSIALRGIRLRSRGREIVVSADSSLTGTTLALQQFTAEAGNTTLTVEGVVALSPRVEARLKATANRLDVDELMALAGAFTPAPAGSAAAQRPSMRIAAAIRAEQATAGTLQIRQFTTDATIEDDSIALSPVRFEIFDGRYEGAVTARLGTQLSATLESRLVDLDLAQLAAFGGVPDTLTGRLSGAGAFTGSGSDVAQLLRAARGTGSATIVDGTIRRLRLVRTVVLFFGRPAPDAEEGTDSFDRFEAKFSLANRVLRAEAISLQSRDADVAGEGSLHLDTEALAGRLDLLLSEALSAQAGTDLYRYTREGNRVLLPASLGGTLAAPRLTIDAAAAARRGLRNEVERRMKDALDRLRRRP
jgi:hypothetical protein